MYVRIYLSRVVHYEEGCISCYNYVLLCPQWIGSILSYWSLLLCVGIAVDVTSEVTGSSAEVCFTASRKSTFECSIDRRAWRSCEFCKP